MARPIKTSERGFTYLMLLLWVVLAGVMLAALGTSWHQMARRDREAEYLWRGEQYRQALLTYSRVSAVMLSASGVPMGGAQQESAYAMPDALSAINAAQRPGTSSLSRARAVNVADVASAAGAAASQASSPIAGPMELRDLLEDRRTGKLVRHLRQLYADPLTNSPTWGLQRSTDGRITGVYSLSTEAPVRSSLGVERYQDLVFSPGAAGVAASAPAGSASGADGLSPSSMGAGDAALSPPGLRSRLRH